MDFEIPDRRSTKIDHYQTDHRRGQLKRSWAIGLHQQRNGSEEIAFNEGLTWGSIGQLLGYLLGDVDDELKDQLYDLMLSQYRLGSRGRSLRMADPQRRLVRVASWNLRYSATKRSRQLLAYLESMDWDVILLQEVSEKAWRLLRKMEDVQALYALDGFGIEPQGKVHHGVAVLARNGLSLHAPQTIAGLPKDERALSVRVEGLETPFRAVTWHAPNASGEGRSVKMQAYTAMTAYLAQLQEPTVLGFDGNHWNRNISLTMAASPDPGSDWYPESEFFCRQPAHNLYDTLIAYLKNDSVGYRRLVQRRPEGPLAVSYIRGSSNKPIPDRFDYIFASEHFDTDYCEYDFEGAIAASSDHALVQADLTLR
ncbi:MAG: endonuclease/exonuclease/phosphatase family protein [Anaerolineales bacterium]|nr:endonuclease/exonuclease/phosphatase family protein [Anaerolineales bacterium]